jgi:hypothetical protein
MVRAMSIPVEDIVEAVLCGVLPGDSQTAHGLETLGLAVAGLPRLPWAAVRLRCLGDRTALAELWPALYRIARRSDSPAACERAGLLASLVLAEDVSPPTVEALKVEVIAEALLLAPSRSYYYRNLRETHLALRARLDSWARQGIGRVAARIRG